jgi:hypothetical protein
MKPSHSLLTVLAFGVASAALVQACGRPLAPESPAAVPSETPALTSAPVMTQESPGGVQMDRPGFEKPPAAAAPSAAPPAASSGPAAASAVAPSAAPASSAAR